MFWPHCSDVTKIVDLSSVGIGNSECWLCYCLKEGGYAPGDIMKEIYKIRNGLLFNTPVFEKWRLK